MTDLFCPDCGTQRDPTIPDFCTKCGRSFTSRPRKRKTIITDLNLIEREPRGYMAARYTAIATIILGWLIIVMGWSLSYYIGITYGRTAETAIEGVQGTIIQDITDEIIFGGGIISTIIGILIIATGQMYLAFLDLRSDTYIIKEFIRLYIEDREERT